jgi:uncharacterized protein
MKKARPTFALDLDVLPGAYVICRWPPGASLPDWVHQGAFVSMTRTPTEVSTVCAADAVPAGTVCEGPWRLFAVRGPLDFALTGLLASLASPLAAAAISMFAISTYDTDYLLVRGGDVERASEVLKKAGHRVFV